MPLERGGLTASGLSYSEPDILIQLSSLGRPWGRMVRGTKGSFRLFPWGEGVAYLCLVDGGHHGLSGSSALVNPASPSL